MAYFEDKEFKKVDIESLEKGDYEYCRFIDCKFDGANLSDFSFIECCFENCDLSSAKIINTSFRDIHFICCKLLGLQFENCNNLLFSVEFEACQLDLSSFYQMSLKNTDFSASQLKDVDFTETDLTASIFNSCDLSDAIFDRSNLEKADFRKATNFSIDPDNNKVKKAKFLKENLSGLLGKYDLNIE